MNAKMQFENRFVVAIDFDRAPGPRYIIEGERSGELLRNSLLKSRVVDAISKKIKLVIDLDGTEGYGTSFLEEVFGGLIREDRISYEDLKRTLVFISTEEPYLLDDIKEYMEDAANET